MKINGRLLLLAVVTGLFMRIWAGSDRSNVRPVAQVRQPAAVVEVQETHSGAQLGDELVSFTPGPIELGDDPLRGVPEPVVRPLPIRAVHDACERWTNETAPIPLPEGLSAGVWHVVNEYGKVARLEFRRSDDGNLPAVNELHVSQIAGSRWYFIRLNTDVRMIPAAVTSHGAGEPGRVEPPLPVELPRVEVTSEPLATEVVELEPVVEEPVAPREYSAAELAEIEAIRSDLQAAAESAAESTRPVSVVAEEPQTELPVITTNEVVPAEPVTESTIIASPVETPAAVPAETAIVADIPDCAVQNRKFDFTGFGGEFSELLTDDRPAPVDLPEEL